MPYSGKDDENLPDNVKELDDDQREKWVDVFNDTFASCQEKGGDDCEAEAMKAANGSVVERVIKKVLRWLSSVFPGIARAIKDVESWDGSASNYPDTDAYCKACLIDVNAAAGRDEKAQDHCMLPVRGPDDDADTYVRQAVHAAAGGHGITQVEKPDDVSQDDWDVAVKAAANKLIRAYSEMDEEPPESLLELDGKTDKTQSRVAKTIQQIAETALAKFYEDEKLAGFFINDIYATDDGGVFLIASANGKLYRMTVDISDSGISFGEPVEVNVEFPVVTEEEKQEQKQDMRRTIIRKQSDGLYRWFTVSCSAVLNRSGMIDSTGLFDSFVKNCQDTGKYPIRQFYHAGAQFRTGKCDFIARDGWLLITSGLYDDTDLARREIVARLDEPDYWGDSIGFTPEKVERLLVGQDNIEIPVYTKGVITEISTLPETEAAAWFTNSQLLTEVRMLQGAQFDALVKLFSGDEAAAKKWLEDNVDETNRAIDRAGMIARSNGETDGQTQTQTQTDNQPATQTPEIVIDEEMLDAIITRAMEGLAPVQEELRSGIASLSEQVTAITEQVTGLVTRLGELEQDEAAKRKRWLADLPAASAAKRSSAATVIYRPRQTEPVAPQGQEPREPDSASVAQSTLASIPQYHN